ncbi:uncharacterized protein [Triticum aestivum]|uniref:uncharacterized protein n=1 Tax=Triticum aestivum TaxID=4565 RepID=UPI001D02F978|nr:uncharacterized protein LOC123068869 [Triticum aestivum]
MASLRGMKATVCSHRDPTTSSIAVVVRFPYGNVVVAAEAGSDHWEVLQRRHGKLSIRNTLPFQGRLYATTLHPPSPEILQLYPPGPTIDNMVATVPGAVRYSRYRDTLHLVESAGRMLLVVRHVMARVTFAIYSVDFDDVDNNGGRPTLTPVSCLGDRALFLGGDVCLSVSARDLPSLSSNSIYFSTPFYPLQVRSVVADDPGRWRRSEELTTQCQIHDRKERTRPWPRCAPSPLPIISSPSATLVSGPKGSCSTSTMSYLNLSRSCGRSGQKTRSCGFHSSPAISKVLIYMDMIE